MVDDRVRGRLADLSQRLSDADWLDGDFSVGDLMMASVLRPLRRSGFVDEFANLGAYVDRGEARPAFQRALQAHLANFTGKPPEGWRSGARRVGKAGVRTCISRCWTSIHKTINITHRRTKK